MNKPIAAIDLGTNSFHLIVVSSDLSSGKFKVVDKAREIVRLGSGSTDMKYLSTPAMNRGVETMKRFKVIADAHAATIRALGTSALREALNGSEFVRRVKSETGIRVETVSGFEEARLIYLGVLQALPVFDKRVLLIDIGGGSTEFLVGRKGEVLYSNSLKVGAIRMTQRFFEQKITEKSIKKCRRYVAGMVSPVFRELKKYGYDMVIGTSGTIENMTQAAYALSEKRLLEKINGATLPREKLFKAVDRVVNTMSVEKLSKMPGIDPSRADIITAGAVILEQIVKELDIKTLTVSEYALREGIVLETAEQKHHIKGHEYIQHAKQRSVDALLLRTGTDIQHARSIARLALQLFDQTHDLHHLGKKERDWLEHAALLHDIGLFVSHAQHHRHSYYLIRNAELSGFTENEKELIAIIARYHRKSHPKIKHEGFGLLSPDERLIVSRLAAILRIADGLDRSHTGQVTGVTCKISRKKVVCRLKSSTKQISIDMWGADRKKQLFEELFTRNFEVKIQGK